MEKLSVDKVVIVVLLPFIQAFSSELVAPFTQKKIYSKCFP